MPLGERVVVGEEPDPEEAREDEVGAPDAVAGEEEACDAVVSAGAVDSGASDDSDSCAAAKVIMQSRRASTLSSEVPVNILMMDVSFPSCDCQTSEGEARDRKARRSRTSACLVAVGMGYKMRKGKVHHGTCQKVVPRKQWFRRLYRPAIFNA